MDIEIQKQYIELSYYTMMHSGPNFIHQHIVDAQIAQWADDKTQPISILFALVGLYLYIELGYTGWQVQKMHNVMAKYKMEWPIIHLPDDRGKINVANVLDVSPGPERDQMIQKWCADVWKTYEKNRDTILKVTSHYLAK